MSCSLSIVRPDNDPSAATLASWAHDTLNDVSASRHTLLQDLRGAQATRAAVEQVLAQSRATFFFGHGTWNSLEGASPLVDQHNIGKATQRIVVAIACGSARDLGDLAVRGGVTGYLGFDEDIGWVVGVSHQVFGSATVSGMKAMLLSGAALSDAAQKMRDEYELVVWYFKYGPGSTNANAQLGWLLANWNRDHVVAKGLVGTVL